MSRLAEPTIQRFERLFLPEPNSGCWIWLGGVTQFGYGHTFERLGRNHFEQIDAHCLSWKLYRGEIPPGLCVLHHCDVPACVNPGHLFLGTKGDNARDAIAKGRRWGDRAGWTHCANGHELTADNLVKGMKQRRCRICANTYARAYAQTPKGRQFKDERLARLRNARRSGNG